MSTLNSLNLLDLETKASQIVKNAGKYIVEQWDEIKETKLKDQRDVVTNIDIEVENIIRRELRSILPDAGFIVEEGQSQEDSELNWTIDPIDGTKNYASSFPQFFVQIALLHQSEPILGLVYNPVSHQLFSAFQGNGTKLNGKPLKAKTVASLNSAIVDVDFGGNDQVLEWKLKILNDLIKSTYRVRMTGGFGNTYMLTGAFDATLYLNQQRKFKYIVDNAPRIILLREAGFETRLLELPDDRKIFVSTSSILMPKLVSLISTKHV